MENLNLFIDGWKEEVKNYYLGLADKLINQELTHKELKEYGVKDYDVVTSLVYTMRFEKGAGIEKALKFIDKEGDKKLNDFLAKVTKYVGEVTDTRALRVSVNYGIDGIIEGTLGKIKVETIVAGGVVQRKHFRMLVKKMK